MTIEARYLHTNLIARDWRVLAAFYCDVFGCERLPGERDYSGDDLDRDTGIPGGRLMGVQVRLPGHGDDGPYMEIYQYEPEQGKGDQSIGAPGFKHIAFEVPDVRAALDEVIAHGGVVGEVVSLTMPNGKKVEWCYATDPEGNAIELQTVEGEGDGND